jgi:hypothetical protein
MEKEFVPYKLALIMRQLGFDEPCFATFFSVGAWQIDCTEGTLNLNYRTPCEYSILAPTFSQAFRWFRENHFLSSDIAERMRDGKRITHFFISDLKTNNKFFKTISSKSFTDYEEAELACLTKLIEIVESKTK